MVSSEGACAAYYRYRRSTAACSDFVLRCPAPLGAAPPSSWRTAAAAALMRELIERDVPARVRRPGAARTGHDGAVVALGRRRGSPSPPTPTSSSPLFFPGGDIGELAVYGTVNDLAMAGRGPRT